MKTSTMRLAASLALAVALGACSTAAPVAPVAPSAMPPVATGPAVSDPTPVPIGSGPVGSGLDGGLVPGGGGGSGTSGSGISSGGSGGSGGGSVPGNPGGGQVPDPQPTIVNPVAGLQGVRAIGAIKLEPGVNASNVSVRISWWSGVEPCSVLAGVTVARDGNTFALTVTEGSKGQGMACIEIAMYKATIVDLGKLDPGTYTISAAGDATAVKVKVNG